MLFDLFNLKIVPSLGEKNKDIRKDLPVRMFNTVLFTITHFRGKS